VKAIIPSSFVADFHEKIGADGLLTGLLLTPREGAQGAHHACGLRRDTEENRLKNAYPP
jgi:hypothetical protein